MNIGYVFKQLTTSRKKTIMRQLLLAVGILLAMSFTFVSVLEKLGLEAEYTNKKILYNIVERHSAEPVSDSDVLQEDNPGTKNADVKAFKIPQTKLLAEIIAGDKRATAKELCAYVKEYVNTPEFKDAYNKLRLQTKPTSEPERMDEESLNALRSALKEQEKQYEELKKNAYVTADMKDQFKKSIDDMRHTIDSNADKTPNASFWKKHYPENPEDAIRARLNEYLSIAATVDFAAQTQGTGKKQTFVKPEYENKSLQWKAIYRAGKDVNQEVTAFINAWLKEGVIKK